MASDDDDNERRSKVASAYRFLKKHYGKSLRYNEMSMKIEENGKPIKNLERFYLKVAVDHKYDIKKDVVSDIIRSLAMGNSYHPVSEYLRKVEKHSDIVDIDNLATVFFGVKNDPYEHVYNAMMKATLVGAVKRIREPGCKHDTALILSGPQGCGKSTFFKELACGKLYEGGFYDDSMLGVENKDEYMKLGKCWFQELGELEKITGTKHAGSIKAFLSSEADLYRMPYEKDVECHPRRCMIVGSTNQDACLEDPTGNRRFWIIPVKVASIDITYLRRERDHIWASAVHAYKKESPNWLSSELQNLAGEIASENVAIDPWKRALLEFIETKQEFRAEDFLAKIKEVGTQTKGDMIKVGNIMKTIPGWYRNKRTRNGIREYVYVKHYPDEIV